MSKGIEAKWNEEKQSGTYGDKIHHGEVKRGAQFYDPGVPSEKQNLAAEKGMEGAKNILRNTYKKSVQPS